jgi:phospholipid-binding lipoprotein MlaA
MADLIPSISEKIGRFGVLCVGVVGFAALGACARPPVSSEINDPHEAENRHVHAFNVALDKAVLRPIAEGAGGSGTGPFATGVKNFASNLDAPGDVLNDLLQLRVGRAAHNTLRFAVNSTIGLGGLFDPARAMGVEAKETDFGETLYVWGVNEGYYMELPFIGPSTARDTFGRAVDYAINPLGLFVKPPESYIGTAAQVLDKVESRARHAETVDSILYGSADSYAQTRLLYLQNRHYQLGQTPADDSFEDPYAE